jgi:hypothetical protein
MTDCADLHDQILLFLQVAEAPSTRARGSGLSSNGPYARTSEFVVRSPFTDVFPTQRSKGIFQATHARLGNVRA